MSFFLPLAQNPTTLHKPFRTRSSRPRSFQCAHRPASTLISAASPITSSTLTPFRFHSRPFTPYFHQCSTDFQTVPNPTDPDHLSSQRSSQLFLSPPPPFRQTVPSPPLSHIYTTHPHHPSQQTPTRPSPFTHNGAPTLCHSLGNFNPPRTTPQRQTQHPTSPALVPTHSNGIQCVVNDKMKELHAPPITTLSLVTNTLYNRVLAESRQPSTHFPPFSTRSNRGEAESSQQSGNAMEVKFVILARARHEAPPRTQTQRTYQCPLHLQISSEGQI